MLGDRPKSANVVIMVFPGRRMRPRQGDAQPPQPRRKPEPVDVAEPLRAVGTSVGAFHMLTRHGHSDRRQMGCFGPYVKRRVCVGQASGLRPDSNGPSESG